MSDQSDKLETTQCISRRSFVAGAAVAGVVAGAAAAHAQSAPKSSVRFVQPARW